MAAVARPILVKVFVILLVLLSFALVISSFVSCRSCYTEPCFEGKGLDPLWRVNDSEGFQVVVLSSLTLIQAIFLVYFLFRAPYTRYKYGLMVGSLEMLALFMLFQLVWWGSKAKMLGDIDSYIGDSSFYEYNNDCDFPVVNCTVSGCGVNPADHTCERKMDVRTSERVVYEAVAALSGLICFLQAGLAVMLHAWHHLFADDNSATGQYTAAPGLK